MNKYEIMFIVKPGMEEAEIKKTAEEMKKVLTDGKANMLEEKAMGQRELAYEIKKFKNGYYFLINLESNDDKAIKEFDRMAGISSDIIRHLITKLED
jgi:small subunit ribosomal protein S6